MTEKKTVIVIGATAAGKSTFCNVISGYGPNGNKFPVGSGIHSKTIDTIREDVSWKGKEFRMNLIDTPGLSGLSYSYFVNDDFVNIIGMIEELKKHESINAFVLVVEQSVIEKETFSEKFANMIVVFMLCYGKEFLKNVIVEVSRWSYSERSKNDRKELDLNEKKVKKFINEKINQILKHFEPESDKAESDTDTELLNLEVVFIDAFAEAKPKYSDERFKYEEQMEVLKSFIDKKDPYTCITSKFSKFEDMLMNLEKSKEKMMGMMNLKKSEEIFVWNMMISYIKEKIEEETKAKRKGSRNPSTSGPITKVKKHRIFDCRPLGGAPLGATFTPFLLLPPNFPPFSLLFTTIGYLALY